MNGVRQFLGVVGLVWVFALMQGATHGNSARDLISGELPSCERIHSALVQADYYPKATDVSAPTPIVTPPTLPSIQRLIPVLLSQGLVLETENVFRPLPYLLFPTGLLPPIPQKSEFYSVF